MRKNYPQALKIMLGYEGGNVDDPRDNGGRTSRGITQRVYTAYRTKLGKPAQDVFRASNDEVADIYKRQYWDVCKCDELPGGIDLIAFNAGINSGPKRSYKMLQASLNRVCNAQLAVDGTPGMVTVLAAKNAPDHDAIVIEFGRKYQAFYRSLNDWPHYGKGWTARNKNATKIGTAWATGAVGPQPITAAVFAQMPDVKKNEAPVINAKARDTDIGVETVGTGSSTGITAGSLAGNGGLEQVQTQVMDTSATLEPLSYMIDYVQYALVGLTLVGVSLGLYAAYRQYKYRRIDDSVDSADIPGFDDLKPEEDIEVDTKPIKKKAKA